MRAPTVCLLASFTSLLLTTMTACSGDDSGGTTGAGGQAGYTQDQAQTHCGELQQANAACFTQDSLDQCVACFVQCADACAAQSMCPEEFLCP